MAEIFLCLNCGCLRDQHDHNLVNEPAEGDLAWIETPAKGYAMSILQCMETEWSAYYTKRVQDLWLEVAHDGFGYVSPDPEAEAAADHERLAMGQQTAFLIVYDPRRGGSFIVPLE